MKRFGPCIAFVLLVACGSDAGDAPADRESGTSSVAGAQGTEPDVQSETASEQTGLIPDRFRGAWDYVEGSCLASSDLRMEIAGDMITFYESMGRVTAVDRSEADEVLVNLAMEGEGESWDTTLRLTLDSPDRLIAADPVGAPEPTDYRKRCSV